MAQLRANTRVYGNTSIDSILVVANVTPYAATSNTTGSLIVTGGAGISGNVYADAMYSNNSVVLTANNYTNHVSSVVAPTGIILQSSVISSNVTIATGNNALSIGPITQANNVVVTLGNGSRWIVI